jgi:hypothetical protein
LPGISQKQRPTPLVSRGRAAFSKLVTDKSESRLRMRAYTGGVGFWQGASERKLRDREMTTQP